MFRLYYLLLLPLPLFAALRKEHIQSLNAIYYSHRFTFFCEQPYDENGQLAAFRCKHCAPHSYSIQWMPIIPFQTLAASLPCYQHRPCYTKTGKPYRGQRCCQKTDPLYATMSTDLNNFVPENPTLIQARKNYAFSDFDDQKSSSGCHFYLDHAHKRLSPAPATRGLIARTYLYFHHRYRLPLTQEEYTLFHHWDKTYPPSDWEKIRFQRIREAP